MNKKDIINIVIVGEIIAIFLIIILFTLKGEIPEKFHFIYNFLWFFPFLFPFFGYLIIKISHLLGRKWFVISQFGKFVFVGFSNLMIDFGVLNLLIYFSGIDKGSFYSIFKGLSFIFALFNSYFWNKFWTFGNNETNSLLRQFFKFFVVVLIGLIINVTIASIVVNNYGSSVSISSTLWANIGALISLVFTMTWNFTGFRLFVFNENKGDSF